MVQGARAQIQPRTNALLRSFMAQADTIGSRDAAGAISRPALPYLRISFANAHLFPTMLRSRLHVRHAPAGLWNGTAIKGGDLWTLHKGGRLAVLELCSHQLGWELRLLVDGDLLRSQVCRAFTEWLDVRDEWKAALLGKGWA